MTKLRLVVEFEYDEQTMFGSDKIEPAELEWLHDELLREGELILHSNTIGEGLGTIKVLDIYSEVGNKLEE